MSTTAVLGCVWGDEAKAKIVDVLAIDADYVVRFQGGNNAGHTIWLKGEKYVFHLVPSGILYPGKICILGSGTVIDPFELTKEIDALKEKGISFRDRFYIDPRAHIVLPIHRELDGIYEEDDNQTLIGTTKRGIGPCYADAIARVGIRFGDLFDKENLIQRLQNLFSYHKYTVENLDKQIADLMEIGTRLGSYLKQIPYLLHKEKDKNILFEGAQGSLLDVNFGTYPFVTSSHTVVGGIAIGSGSGGKVDRVVGVFKSYFTRVGEGPFPTELFDEIGERIRIQGNEFGSTTGRPRRCGWFDAMAAQFTAMINNLDEIALTLLDVFSGLETLKVCIGYRLNGEKISEFPYSSNDLTKVEPEYIELPGWKDDITGIREFDKLPVNAKNYISTIEELLGIDISIISVGPDREQTIFRNK
jgi:adenylosuccinate synthase